MDKNNGTKTKDETTNKLMTFLNALLTHTLNAQARHNTLCLTCSKRDEGRSIKGSKISSSFIKSLESLEDGGRELHLFRTSGVDGATEEMRRGKMKIFHVRLSGPSRCNSCCGVELTVSICSGPIRTTPINTEFVITYAKIWSGQLGWGKTKTDGRLMR
ncbi:unnamed protein product [Orchesella dallaii]|uniref:Uncharacterized protein n=1 Tax=Orchesella dallaii TaxID=48710 RepID=A0ABP1R330_9HEXA